MKKEKIAVVQDFALNSPGGGPRIMRALLGQGPINYVVVCPAQTNVPLAENHFYYSLRPSMGFLEYTRLHHFFTFLDWILMNKIQKFLRQICVSQSVSLIHCIPHYLSFVAAYKVSKELGIPLVINVHDDLKYLHKNPIIFRDLEPYLAAAWRDAVVRFAISREMGAEYNHRYGERTFDLVTDGVGDVPNSAVATREQTLSIYFGGLFHLSYEVNLEALLKALDIFAQKNPSYTVEVVLRCGDTRVRNFSSRISFKILPFGSEADVANDMKQATLLYLPLPFGPDHENFVKFSLSTKLITYLGSGLPILYHGPKQSAAANLVSENKAAYISSSLETEEILSVLQSAILSPSNTVNNALSLAKERFLLSIQRERFWSPIVETLESRAEGDRP